MNVRFLNAQPGLSVDNIDDALAFYSKLGFRPVYRNEDMHLVIQKDSVTLHLSAEHSSPGGGQIMVDDVQQLYDCVVSLNVRMLYDGLGDRPWGCRDFSIEDPFGNRLTFGQQM